MNVLSLFDGISCGRLSLERAGVTVDNYYASEVDKFAIKVSNDNWTDIVQLGDVTKWKDWNINWGTIDLLIGGSPCQGFSFAGKQLAFSDPRSALFFVYVDILNHIKKINPNVKFLLENVKMKKEFLSVIDEHLGVKGVLINSSLVSAQNRERYYWCNWNVTQPTDMQIPMKSILECESGNFKGGRMVGRRVNPKTGKRDDYNKTIPIMQYIEERKDSKIGCLTTVCKDSICIEVGKAELNGHDFLKRVYSKEAKCPTLTAVCGGNQQRKVATDFDRWRFLTPVEYERGQTFPDGYTSCVSNSQRYKALGNSWTVDVISHLFKGLL
jgi:DNA-cytosine methyltransferase